MIKKLSILIGVLFFVAACNKDQIVQMPAAGATPVAFPQPNNFPKASIPSDNPLTREGINLGRHLFFEKKLSGDNSQSCSSCHFQENNFADPRQFSVGIDGSIGDRNAMILSNLAWQSFFFWDGRSFSMEDQALQPVENPIEMNAEWPDVIDKLKADPLYQTLFEAAFGPDAITKENAAKAIAQFERMMVSADSKFDQWRRGETAFSQLEEDGYEIFSTEEGDCFHCHGDLNTGNIFGAYGDLQFSNNGLDSVLTPNTGYEVVTLDFNDRAKFKIPSLRNVEYSFPYMHDGRFNTLQEVIEFYSTGVNKTYTLDPNMEKNGRIKKDFTTYQKAALLAFLKTLSDEAFLTDTSFTDPF
jgi:cytochrome c peroxidase